MMSDVQDFYRRVFARSMVSDNEFLTFRNGVFNHPVVTPNFLLNADISIESIRRNQQPWICVEKIGSEDLFLSEGYKLALSPTYLFHTKAVISSSNGIQLVDYNELSQDLKDDCDDKLCKNSVNLDRSTLQLVERVFAESECKVQKRVALDNANGVPIGSLTFISSGPTAIMLNAWVDARCRARGVMNAIASSLQIPFFEDGGKLVFCWTLNPIINKKGDFQAPFQIYKK